MKSDLTNEYGVPTSTKVYALCLYPHFIWPWMLWPSVFLWVGALVFCYSRRVRRWVRVTIFALLSALLDE